MARSSKVSPQARAVTVVPRKFTCFRYLPRELQFAIWELALFERAVCTVTRSEEAHDGTGSESFSITDYRPSNSRVAQACSDSRRVMKQLHARPWDPVISKAPSSDALDTTVVYFADALSVRGFLETFSSDFVSALEHVALPPCHWDQAARILVAMEKHCPSLRSITVTWAKGRASESSSVLQGRKLSLEAFIMYAALSERSKEEYTSPGLCSWQAFADLSLIPVAQDSKAYIRSFFQEYFTGNSLRPGQGCRVSPPRIHLLGPVSV